MASSNSKVATGTPGALLYICDAPANLDFGIDCMNYETGPNFRGMSMIPPGLHFVYFSTGLGSRQGFFVQCAEGDLVVRSWDPANEEITATNVLSDASMAALKLSLELGELNHQLGPYPFPQHHTWLNLSAHISATVLERTDCAPGSMVIPGVAEDMEALPGNSSSSTSSSERSSRAVKHYFPGLARVARFADLAAAEANLREAAHAHPSSPDRAQLLTSLYMDKTKISQHLVDSYFGGSWNELLGEMQLAFVLFLLVFSHPALVYWKAAVHLVCCSETLVHQQPSVVASFIKCFHAQLNFSPEDFFEIELSRENFLRPSLSALFTALSGADVPDPLPEYSKRLLKFVRKKFDLYPDAGQGELKGQGQDALEIFNLVDEDMPVVVKMHDDSSADPMGMDEIDVAGGEEVHTCSSPSLARRRSLCEEQRAELVQGLERRWGAFDAIVGSSPPPLPPPFVSSSNTAASEPAELLPEKPTVVEVVMDAPMSPIEMETALFGWRYPLLYEANKSASGREDFIMTAARIVAEIGGGGGGDGATSAHLRKEAMLFIDNEHSLSKTA